MPTSTPKEGNNSAQWSCHQYAILHTNQRISRAGALSFCGGGQQTSLHPFGCDRGQCRRLQETAVALMVSSIPNLTHKSKGLEGRGAWFFVAEPNKPPLTHSVGIENNLTPRGDSSSSDDVINTQSYTHIRGSGGQERLVFVAEPNKPPSTHYV